MQTEHLSFRASPALAAALTEHADRAGCSVSEYLRSIARERVGLQSAAPKLSAGGPVNPYAHLKAIAAGDVEAMRLLAREGARLASQELSECAVIEALVFARLAYARSGCIGDAGLILGLLGLACELLGEDGGDLRESWEAEGVALLSLLADDGVDAADAALPQAMEEVSRGAAVLSKAVRNLMIEGTS
jgi:hypothetical protein